MRILQSILILVVSVVLCSLSANVAKAQQSQDIMVAGYKHNPPVGTPGSGMITVTLKDDTLKVSGDFEELTSNFYGAYIMVSLKGHSGNQLYTLNAELNNAKTGGVLKAENNSFKLSEAELKLLNNGELFINISSYDHKTGELRGDISPMGK